MDDREVAERLGKVPGWSAAAGRLVRTAKFASFEDAIAFMARSAFEAARLDHHPDWSNSYRSVRIELTTHEAGGLSDLDFELASRMNRIMSAFNLQ